MFKGHFPVWKKAPILKLLLPLVIGISLKWNLQVPLKYAWFVVDISIPLLFAPFFLSLFSQFRLTVTNGVAVTLLFISIGCLITGYKDIRQDPRWYGKYYTPGYLVKATLREPLIEKQNSYKALAELTSVSDTRKVVSTAGNVIIYFSKGSILPALDVGSEIIFSNSLEEIKNEGNPGGFDYKRYCLFQDITHRVYLKQSDFIVSDEKDPGFFGKILFPARQKVLSILRTYIHGAKEYGLAEALLIGYKDDLDKHLVQSYTNTGVVHIIAISGMHIALIYWLLAFLCKPLKKIKRSKWFAAAIIISGLWLFSLMAGAQASVVRSAVMFSCIVLAKNFSRKTSIYNTLALSAFILLCINPYWLWDVGFQLSYAAVLSIVIFMRPIYNWFYIKNKILDFIWKLNAVSLAAQLLTTPLSIYHFHQFANFFLLTNFVAIPISSTIVLGEIFLCAISFFPSFANIHGKILSWLIGLMNSYIEKIERLPGSLWGGMHASILQTVLLFLVVAGFGYLLLEKQKTGTWIGLFGAVCFISLRSFSFYQSNRQQKLVIYNIPKHQGIDIISGRNYFFVGDSDLCADDFLSDFYLKSSRIMHRVKRTNHLAHFFCQQGFLAYNSVRVLIVGKDYEFDTCVRKIPLNLLVVSKNPKVHLSNLLKTFLIKQVVFDGSVSPPILSRWIKDCNSLHLPYHNVSEKGAFEMKLN